MGFFKKTKAESYEVVAHEGKKISSLEEANKITTAFELAELEAQKTEKK